MKIEALEARVAAPDGRDPRRIGFTADPQDRRAGAVAEGRSPADAATSRFDTHRRIARFTLPVWFYVSVTGVVVFALLRAYV